MVNEEEVLRNKIISVVSHEFRTPLATLTLSANYLIKHREKLSNEVIDKKLHQILEQVNLLTHSVDNFLELRKIQKSAIAVIKRPVDLVALIEKKINETQKEFDFSHKIELHAPDSHVVLEADELILGTVFSSLLKNAVKFSPGKDKVRVTIKESENTISVEVTDEGIGIDEGDAEKIFDSFYRGKNASFFPGVGIGLAIVRQGVQAHEGRVTVQSIPEKGTSFIVELPRS